MKDSGKVFQVKVYPPFGKLQKRGIAFRTREARLAHSNSAETAFGYITTVSCPRTPGMMSAKRISGPRHRNPSFVRVARLTGQSLPICLVFEGMRFANQLGEPIGKAAQTAAGSALRQRAAKHFQDMLCGTECFNQTWQIGACVV
jgi:hypothetical protein